MVRGSGSESGDKESSKCSYDGTLKRWLPGKIKLKSALYKAGLWDVVEKGPSTAQTQPESIVPGYESTTPQGWYYAGRDNKVQGPCSAEELTRVFNNILQSEGRLEGESVYVHHADNTSGDWAPWSESVSRKVHVQSSIESNMRKFRTPHPFVGDDAAVRKLSFGQTDWRGGATLASPTPSARDRELGQQRPCTAENDRTAFHIIVQAIDDSDGSIGESLLLTIANLFEDAESGHELFKYLETRANGSDQGGLVDADDIKRQIDDYKFCEGKLITVRSNGQKFQAITSTDAESHGIASAMYEGIVIRGHAKWSGVPFTKPTRLENDNSGGVMVARDAASMHHSRATAMRAVFCQECVELGMFDPKHVPASSMTADVLTKWLSLNDFAKHRGKLTNRRAQYKMLEQQKI